MILLLSIYVLSVHAAFLLGIAMAFQGWVSTAVNFIYISQGYVPFESWAIVGVAIHAIALGTRLRR
jgi:di/tricarboxylate transporter